MIEDKIILNCSENETIEDYINRLYQNKHTYNLTWNDIAILCNKNFNLNYDESTYRRKYKKYYPNNEYIKNKQSFKTIINQFSESIYSEDQENKLHKLIQKNIQLEKTIRKERIRLQTEKIEYNKWMREHERNEMICEKIQDAIKLLTPVQVPTSTMNIDNKDVDKYYMLCIGDQHYGVEFKIQGFNNDIINEYNPKIFQQRMWNLYQQIVCLVKKENIKVLYVNDFGDSIDGLLRISQLWKLKYGVIESTIQYANFMSEWLNSLTHYVNIVYQMVDDSNHSQLRLLGEPKNTFKNENMSKIIITFIKEALRNNPRFKLESNETGMIFNKFGNYNIIGIHGEVKDMNKALTQISNIFHITINYLIAGHIHHYRAEEINKNVEVINIPSIIGVDDYSVSTLRSSSAGAKLFCFSGKLGKQIEYSFKLN